jgi:hypothetical protein
MDGSRFDAIARAVAMPGSRRRLLGSLAAGALGLVGLGKADAAAGCRMPGDLCRENANCCSNLCGKDATGRRVCQCQSPTDCPAPDQCHTATCVKGVCGTTVRLGQACNDGDACTTGETCQANGRCGGGNPVVCTALDQCHTAACNRVDGRCVQTPLTGTACNADDNACTADTCQAGVCTPGTPKVCTASDQCHDAGTCDRTTGLCPNPAKPDGTACNDGDACTQTDTCRGGVCVGGNPVVCTALDQCHTTACNPADGQCVQTPLTGTACNDGDACTQTDTCQAGTCVGGNPVVCTALDQCHTAGVCNSTTGQCSNPNAPDATACENPDPCIAGGACQGGTCVGGTPVPNNQPGSCPGVQVCCAGSCCAGFCSGGTCCFNNGSPCSANGQCCGGNCSNGHCLDL